MAETREQAAARCRAYYLAHRAKIIASAAARYAANRGAIIAANQARVALDRTAANAAQARHAQQPHVRLARAATESRRRAGRGVVVDRFQVWFLGAGICGSHVDVDEMHVDHVAPLIKGGPHVLTNLQPAHAGCNLRKGGR